MRFGWFVVVLGLRVAGRAGETPRRLGRRPHCKSLHHVQDGINDVSCVEKVRGRLRACGYPETAPFRLDGGVRSADANAGLDGYNQSLLDFFSARLR